MGNSESKTTSNATTTSAADTPAMRASDPTPRRPSTSARASSAPSTRSNSLTNDQMTTATPPATTTRTASSSSSTRRSRSRKPSRTTDQIEAGGIERGQQATEDATNQLSYWYLLKHGYNELVHLIIRPPRASYEVNDLGPSAFTFAGLSYQRIDFSVINDRHQTLRCSHWLPDHTDIHGLDAFPCVIYLHGNSSCRVEALSILRTCLASGMTVVAFDCAGCGHSDGEYISLGYYERDDLKAVIEYLRQHSRVSTIGLWGRSMGAATALLHADRDPSIAGIVVDSAFTTLEQLVQEIVERGRQDGYTIPSFAVKLVMRWIRSSVQKRAGFDLKRLAPIDHAAMSFVPALFVAATDDQFIASHHAQTLHDRYAGDKNIVLVAGDHNTQRPQYLLDSAGIFLNTALHVDVRLLPDAPPIAARGRGRRLPWGETTRATRVETQDETFGLRLSDLDAAFHGTGDNRMQVGPSHAWTCRQCTFGNAALRSKCDMCHTPFHAPSDRTGTSDAEVTAEVEEALTSRAVAIALSMVPTDTLEPKEESEAEEEDESDEEDGDDELRPHVTDSARTI